MSGVDWSRLDLWQPPTQQAPALPRLLRSRPSFTTRLLVMLSIANLALTACVLALTLGRLLE